jgi:DNA repair exonuclease SbcCD ATPase subunit
LTESVLNGTSTIAIGELNTFFDAVYRNDETHYLQNVAVGSAAVVPFHFVMKGVVKSLSKTAEIFNVVTKESSDLATAKASARAITGDDSINPTSHITADEGVIAEKAKAQKVEADLAAARESRVVIRQTGESPTVGPNELLYLVQSEAARQSGKPEGTLLQSLLDEFRKGRRDLTLFEKMAAAMDRSYDPFAVHPQDIFFVEKVFGGEQAAHIARANELIGRLPNEINILQNALAKLSRMINEFADSPQIAQIQKAIEEVNAQRSVIEKQRNQLLSDKKKFPIYAKEIDAKIKALDPEYAALKEKAKRLKGERAKAQAENSARIDQLKKNHDSLTAELYAHREARTKYGPKTEAPKQLYPRELMLQAREQVAKRNAQLSERTNTIVVNGKTIQLNPKLTDVAQKLAATRDEMFRIGKLIEDAFEKGEYEPRMVEWAKRLRDLERGERSLYNRYNELVAELNVAKARENLEPLKQKKAELQKKLDAAKEAENNELITTIKKQIAELEIEAEPLKRAIQEQKDLASIVKIEDEINTLQVLIEELKAKEQQARIDKNSNLELELANKRDVAEKQLEKLVEQLDSKEKVKSRPLNADEVSNHRAKRRADIEETVRDEREKAVKIAIESDDPAFSAKQEIKEAQQTASQLEKQRETPQSKEYRAASADQEKITSIEKRESDEFVSAINDDIKKLREFATPEPGTQQTSAQKKAQLRAEQFEAILKDAESQISKEIDQINTDHDGVVAMLDCMSKTGN